MIGARKETLGKTRTETKEMSSPRNESMERADLTMEDWIQETCLISAVTSGPTEPKTFQEAWHSPSENNWRAAIRKEIRSIINRACCEHFGLFSPVRLTVSEVLKSFWDCPGVVSTTCCHCDIIWCVHDVILSNSSFKSSALHPFTFVTSSSATRSSNHLAIIHSHL